MAVQSVKIFLKLFMDPRRTYLPSVNTLAYARKYRLLHWADSFKRNMYITTDFSLPSMINS